MLWTILRSWRKEKKRSRKGPRLLLLEALEDRTAPAILSWIGGSGAGGTYNWSNPDNWDTHTQPKANDVLVFGKGAKTDSTMDAAFGDLVKKVVVLRSFHRTLTLTHSLDVTDSLSIASGTVAVAEGVLKSNRTALLGGTLTGSFSVGGVGGLPGEMLWSGGTMANGATTILTNSTMTIDGKATATDRLISNNGTIDYVGGRFTISRIDNYATFNIVGDLTLAREDRQARFNNYGFLNKTMGANDAVIRSDFYNYGQVDILSGTLTLGRSGEHTGVFNIPEVCTLAIINTGPPGIVNLFKAGVQINGTGTVNVNSGGILVVDKGATLRVPGTFVLLDAASFLRGEGTFSAHRFEFDGSNQTGKGVTLISKDDLMIIQGDGDAGETIAERRIMNFGTITWSGRGNLFTSDAAEIVNDGADGQGVFQITTGASIVKEPGSAAAKLVVQNQGVLRKIAGDENVIQIPVENNNGKLRLNGLKMDFQGGYKQTGGDTLLQGGTLQVTGVYDQRGGDTKLGGGLLEVTGSLSQTAGTVALDGGEIRATEGYDIQSATLTGSGLIVSDVRNGGAVYPGGAGVLGAITIRGPLAYTQTGAGSLEIDVTPLISDLLNVEGTVHLAGTLNVSGVGGAALYIVIDNDDVDPVIGYFANHPEGDTVTVGGVDYTITYHGGDGNDVVLFQGPRISGPASVDEGDAYTLTLNDGGVQPIYWTIFWGDGNFETLDGNPSSATHLYDDGTRTYTISATLTGSDGVSTYTTNDHDVEVLNLPPTPAITGLPSSANEGDSIALGGDVSDPSQADEDAGFTYSWTVFGPFGLAVASGSEADFSFTPDDNGVYTINLTATDKDGGVGSIVEEITVSNVAPTATFSGGGTVDEGTTSPVTVSFSNVSDPSEADTNAGFFYVFDFDGDGVYETSSGSGSAAVPVYLLDDGPRELTVSGRVYDKDGGYASGSAVITVNNVAPSASFANDGSVQAGEPVNVYFSDATDPSGADMAAGLRYSIALSPGGLASSYATASFMSFASFTFTESGEHVVYGRVFDDDGGQANYTTTVVVEPPPPVSVSIINNVTQPENSGTFAFTVQLSEPTSQTVTVDYQTSNGTATAGSDYTAKSGTLTFLPGEFFKTIEVAVSNDSTYEHDEYFTLTLSNADGAGIADGEGAATILNDDLLPLVHIDGVTAKEGQSGTKTFTFTLTLTGSTEVAASVDFFTQSGSAGEGSDYQAASATVTFAVGETSKTVNVTVYGDTDVEADEVFYGNLINTVDCGLDNYSATATIINDDASIMVIDAPSLSEGDSGQQAHPFIVMVNPGPSGVLTETVTVQYSTQDGSATAGSDYAAASGTLTFTPGGSLVQDITIYSFGDTTVEGNETFTFVLSNATNATITDGSGETTIVNDDIAPPNDPTLPGAMSADAVVDPNDALLVTTLDDDAPPKSQGNGHDDDRPQPQPDAHARAASEVSVVLSDDTDYQVHGVLARGLASDGGFEFHGRHNELFALWYESL